MAGNLGKSISGKLSVGPERRSEGLPAAEEGCGFGTGLSFRSSSLNIYGINLLSCHAPGMTDDPFDGRPGFHFVVFHNDVRLNTAGGETDCPAGSLVIFSPGTGRSFGSPDGPWGCSCLCVGGPWIRRQLSKAGLSLDSVIPLRKRVSFRVHLAGIYEEMLRRRRPDGAILRNLLTNWLRELQRQTPEPEFSRSLPLMLALKDFISATLDRPWKLGDMAETAGMDISHFCKQFHDCFGISPMHCLARMRMEHAAMLLQAGSHDVSWTAREVGYANASSFSSQFRKHFGVSPSSMRQGRLPAVLLPEDTLWEHAMLMARSGKRIVEIAEDLGFKDMSDFEKGYQRLLGHMPEDDRSESLAWGAPEKVSIAWDACLLRGARRSHTPGLDIFGLGVGYRKKAGFSVYDHGKKGYLFLVLHDEGTVIHEEKNYLCPAESLVIFSSEGDKHFGNPDKPWNHSYVYLGGSWVERQIDANRFPLDKAIPLSDAVFSGRYLTKVFNETLQSRPDPVILRSLLQNWFMGIKGSLEKGRDYRPVDRLDDVKRYLDAEFTRPLHLERLAGMAFLSPDHFGKLFKVRYGLSPMQYVTQLRMLQAVHLLGEGWRNVSTTAQESGYGEMRLFEYHFKGHFGIRPSEMLSAGRH